MLHAHVHTATRPCLRALCRIALPGRPRRPRTRGVECRVLEVVCRTVGFTCVRTSACAACPRVSARGTAGALARGHGDPAAVPASPDRQRLYGIIVNLTRSVYLGLTFVFPCFDLSNMRACTFCLRCRFVLYTSQLGGGDDFIKIMLISYDV
jgi:hypothetical protein